MLHMEPLGGDPTGIAVAQQEVIMRCASLAFGSRWRGCAVGSLTPELRRGPQDDSCDPLGGKNGTTNRYLARFQLIDACVILLRLPFSYGPP